MKPPGAGSLHPYVPDLLIRQLTGSDPKAVREGVESFPAALMFADISGSTELTQRIVGADARGVEELSKIFDEYFGSLIDVVIAYAGDVVKFAGDALLAMWPSDGLDLTESCLRAASCALAAQEALRPGSPAAHGMLSRIAVTSGDVSVMHLGGLRDRWELIITGPPVSDFSRLKHLIDPGQVLVSAAAWELLRADAHVEPVGTEAVRLEGLEGRAKASSPDRPSLPEELAGEIRGYVPGAIVSRIEAGQEAWLAELRRVTIVFVELPGFSDSVPRELAHSIVGGLQRCIYDQEGSVNKLSMDEKGISLFAVFGLPPLAHRNDAGRGIRAALAMAHVLEDGHVSGAIGLATGSVFAGSLGNSRRRDYSVIGEIPNIAARLAEVAGADKRDTVTVLCDEGTRRDAALEFEFGPAQAVIPRGMTHPVNVYEPTASTVTPPRQARFVGRERERSLLQGALDSLVAGTGATLIIEGEPGIGKTRLIQTLIDDAASRGVRVLMGGADSNGRTTPYNAWRPLFRSLLEEGKGSISSSEVTASLMRLVPDQSDLFPLLNVVAMTDIPDNEVTATLTAVARAQATNELLTRLLAASAAGRLVVLEDGHWFDSASWRLAGLAGRAPDEILLVITTRPLADPVPDDYRVLSSQEGAQTLAMMGLTAAETRLLVADRLDVDEVSPELGELMSQRTDGNPFFVEELTHALLEQDVIRIEHGKAHLPADSGQLESLDVPGTIWGIIAGRIDDLPPEPQLTLKVASVIGRSFDEEVLRRIHPMAEYVPISGEHLKHLDRYGLIERAPGEPSYRFRHDLIQEVAYSLLPTDRRRQIHAGVAEFLERSPEVEIEAVVPLLAHHWGQAADYKKALGYLVRAGQQTLQAGAYSEAVRSVEDALSINEREHLVEDPYELAQWHFILGQAYRSAGNLAGSLAHHRRVSELIGEAPPKVLTLGLATEGIRQLVRRLRSPVRVPEGPGSIKARLGASTYEELFTIAYHRAEPTLTLYSVLRNVNLAEEASSPPLLARAYAAMASTAGYSSLHGLAERYIRLAYDQLEQGTDRTDRARVDQYVHIYRAGVGGRWDETEALAEEAIRLFEPLGDRRWLENLSILAVILTIRGRLGRARQLCEDMYREALRRGDPQMQAIGLLEQTQIALLEGRLDDAHALLGEAEELATGQGRSELIWLHGLRAQASVRTGRSAEALEQARRAEELATGLPLGYYTLEGYSGMCEAFFSLWEEGSSDLRGRARGATGALARFARVFPVGRAAALRWKGEYLWLTGKTLQAVRAWRRGIEQALTKDLPIEEARLRFHLGRRLPATDDERGRQLHAASDTFERLGASYELGGVGAALG